MSLQRQFRVLCSFILYLVMIILVSACSTARNDQSASELINATFFVSPSGNDNWSGTLSEPKNNRDGPFFTIGRAQQAVRALLEDSQKEDIVILIRSGTYYLDEPLVFSPNDSGQGEFKVVYRNFPGETPTVSGGVLLSNWDLYDGKIFTTKVNQDFATLFENSHTGVLARYPNQDPEAKNPGKNIYTKVAEVLEGREYAGFYFDPETFPVLTRYDNLELRIWNGGPLGFQHWRTYLGQVTEISYDEQTLLAQLDGITPDVYNILGPGTDYYIQNALELLDHPGEFYLEEDSLYYWPHQIPIEEQTIVTSHLHSIIRFEGYDTSLVKNITVEGLEIIHSDREISLWANKSSSAAIYLTNAANIQIAGNRIHNIGGKGILGYGDNITNITVESNLIYDIGDTAVQFNGWEDSEKNSHNNILNNHIHHVGLITPHAVGIWLNKSSQNLIANNLLHDIPNAAIQVHGSSMNDGPVSFGNVIEFNEFHTVTLDFQDMGLIYFGHAGPDNEIHNNYFHDSNIPFSWGCGIYLDEYASGTAVTNNLIENLQLEGDGYLSGLIEAGDIETLIQNNIMAFNNVEMGGVIWPREYCPQGGGCPEAAVTPPNDIDVLNNIFYNNAGPLYHFQFGHEESWLRKADNNLFFNDRDIYMIDGIPGVTTLEAWQAIPSREYDQGSITTDPLFIDADHGDYRLRFDSPATTLGIEDINFAVIGLRSDFPFQSSDSSLDRMFITSDTNGTRSYIEISVDQQAQIQFTARSSSGYVLDPEEYQTHCMSRDSDIADINPDGLISGIQSGVTIINCSLTQADKTLSMPIYVLVNMSIEEASRKIPPELSTLPIVPYLGALAEIDFETDRGMFKSNPSHNNWQVIEEDGSKIYCGYSEDSYINSVFGSVEWENYQVEALIRIIGEDDFSGGLISRNSVGRQWGSYSHTIDAGSGFHGVSQGYCGVDRCDIWQGTNSSIDAGEWYLLRAELDGNRIRTYLDGRLMNSNVLENRKYGNVGIAASPGTTVCVDEIIVRSLDRAPESLDLATKANTNASMEVYFNPDSTSKIIGDVPLGVKLFLLSQTSDQNWSFVRHEQDGLQGWVLSENLDISAIVEETQVEDSIPVVTVTPAPTDDIRNEENLLFTGNWESTDNDGSQQTLLIVSLADGDFSATYMDDGASLCGTDSSGRPLYGVKLEGVGQLSGNFLKFPGLNVICLGDPEWNLDPLPFQVTYDLASDSLHDAWGIVWNRQP